MIIDNRKIYIKIFVIALNHFAIFSLDDMPAEIQSEICRYLPIKDLKSLLLSSRSLSLQAQFEIDKRTGLNYIYKKMSPQEFKKMTACPSDCDKKYHNEKITAFVEDAPYFSDVDLVELWSSVDENYLKARNKHEANPIFFVEKITAHKAYYELTQLGKSLVAMPPDVLKNIQYINTTDFEISAEIILKNAAIKFLPNNWRDLEDIHTKQKIKSVVFSGLKNLKAIPEGLGLISDLETLTIFKCPLIKSIGILKFCLLDKMNKLKTIQIDPELGRFIENNTEIAHLFKKDKRELLNSITYHRISS